ncbi:hypothetical protein [uncultured Microbacterium sp.]|uniref:hypothetical protein n=1 Tax=uncultured Microbacterium sp. TaxID=191216 RepID=UPI0026171504|nr:hypothetical protein [uncultured Microbacterium sp.]
MTSSSSDLPSGVRYEKLRGLVLAMSSGDPDLTTTWLADRLAEIPASYDEFMDVQEHAAANIADPEADADVERMVIRSLRTERKAAAATDGWLERATSEASFDWSGVAKLTGLDEDVLRRRASAPIDGRIPRVNVKGGLPMTAAAEALGISRATLYTWIKQGKVKQIVLDGRKVIAVDANGKPIVQ